MFLIETINDCLNKIFYGGITDDEELIKELKSEWESEYKGVSIKWKVSIKWWVSIKEAAIEWFGLCFNPESTPLKGGSEKTNSVSNEKPEECSNPIKTPSKRTTQEINGVSNKYLIQQGENLSLETDGNPIPSTKDGQMDNNPNALVSNSEGSSRLDIGSYEKQETPGQGEKPTNAAADEKVIKGNKEKRRGVKREIKGK
ncbi:MAG: hypothetical protein ACRCST_05330 [Turicibacter sp.]